MTNFADILSEACQGKDLAKVCYFLENGDTATFYEINNVADRIGGWLRSIGLSEGDKVALTCINSPYFPAIFMGVLKAGGVAVILGNLLKEKEIRLLLEDSNAVAYFCHENTSLFEEGKTAFANAPNCKYFMPVPNWTNAATEFLGKYEGIEFTIPRKPKDLALMMYTSGSTGKPKSVLISHQNLKSSTEIAIHTFQYQSNDVGLAALPFSHSFAFTVLMNACLLNGNAVVLLNGFSPEKTIHGIEQHNASVFCGVPTMYVALVSYMDELKDKPSLAALRLCVCGGAMLPPALPLALQQHTGIVLSEVYGMTETIGCIAFNLEPTGERRTSIGKAVQGMEVKVLSEDGMPLEPDKVGELVCKGDAVMLGYNIDEPNTGDVFIKDDWLYTGDLASIDKEGYIYLKGRAKDIIIRGGRNIYPNEVEEVLLTHPFVKLAAVIAIPDDLYGEEVKAVVVIEGSINASELQDYCKSQMAAYKYPRVIEFRDQLPMTEAGKINKKLLE